MWTVYRWRGFRICFWFWPIVQNYLSELFQSMTLASKIIIFTAPKRKINSYCAETYGKFEFNLWKFISMSSLAYIQDYFLISNEIILSKTISKTCAWLANLMQTYVSQRKRVKNTKQISVWIDIYQLIICINAAIKHFKDFFWLQFHFVRSESSQLLMTAKILMLFQIFWVLRLFEQQEQRSKQQSSIKQRQQRKGWLLIMPNLFWTSFVKESNNFVKTTKIITANFLHVILVPFFKSNCIKHWDTLWNSTVCEKDASVWDNNLIGF